MAENLREVIARRLANSPTSKTPTPAPAPKPAKVEVPKEVEEESFDDEADEVEVPATSEETPTSPEKIDEDAQKQQMEMIFREIELLQNNGRFRAELLHQLNEINKSLSVVSNAILDLTKVEVDGKE